MNSLLKFVLPRGRGWWRVLIGVPVIYAAYAGALWSLQERFIFRTDFAGVEPWPADTASEKTVFITLADGGTVPARLLLPAPQAGLTQGALMGGAGVGGAGVGSAGANAKRPAAICFHGNWDLAHTFTRAPEVQALLRMGFVVLVPEYRGYVAGGRPGQRAIVEDAGRFAQLLAARPDVDPARLVYVGRSLGSGVACALAANPPAGAGPRAMVLLSPFTSVASFAWQMGVPGVLVRHPFRNDVALSQLDVPVLIVHGRNDTVVPIKHGRTLARLAKDATMFEDDGDHNDLPLDDAAFGDALRDLMTRAGVLGPAQEMRESPSSTPTPAPGRRGW